MTNVAYLPEPEKGLEEEIADLRAALKEADDEKAALRRHINTLSNEVYELGEELDEVQDELQRARGGHIRDLIDTKINRIRYLGLDTEQTALDVLDELHRELEGVAA